MVKHNLQGADLIMEDAQIIFSGLWVALMPTCLLGDVLRIFAGDFKPGEMEGKKMSQKMLLEMAILMLIRSLCFSCLCLAV
jgi:ABC-type transport system involved in cytochrome c biogenesis permease component